MYLTANNSLQMFVLVHQAISEPILYTYIYFDIVIKPQIE